MQPFRNPEALGLLPGGSDGRLRIASWEGPLLHNFIYLMKADARNGVVFLGRQCQAPSDFGKWVEVSMTIRWASDNSGWLKLLCGDRLVYADENVATNQAPHCYAANVCEPGKFKDPESFLFLLGPVVGGYGHDYAEHGFSSPFVDIQPDGITIQVRDMAVGPGGEMYTEADRALVARLQERLNTLGCDVGAVDGRVGNRTRTRALDCRYFGDGVLPEKLTLASLPEFVERYNEPGVGGLPREAPPSKPSRMTSVSAYSEVIPNGDTLLNFEATADGSVALNAILIGRFDDAGNTPRLEVLFEDDIGSGLAGAVRRCMGVRIENWGDGSVHLVMGFRVLGTPVGVDCLSDALPADLAAKVRALVDLFPELAEELSAPQALSQIDHPGIRAFINRVADGDVVVASGPS